MYSSGHGIDRKEFTDTAFLFGWRVRCRESILALAFAYAVTGGESGQHPETVRDDEYAYVE